MTRRKSRPFTATQAVIMQHRINRLVGPVVDKKRNELEIVAEMLKDYAVLLRREEEAALQEL